MKSATFSDFSSSLNQTNIGNQPILDRMGVKYFVLPSPDVAGQQQPLAPANGSVDVGTGSATCTLPAQPVRGVTVQLSRPLVGPSAEDGPTLHVAVRAGDQTIASGRYLDPRAPVGQKVVIPVVGEDLPRNGSMTVTVNASEARNGLALATVNGVVDCAAVSPIDDGLKLVHADPAAVIYQRLNALPRIRWASRAMVVSDPAQRVADLARGLPRGRGRPQRTGTRGRRPERKRGHAGRYR